MRNYKNKSILWNQIWKDAGCPSNGELANIRRNTRKKYHDSVKYIKRYRDDITRNDVPQSLQNHNSKEFWVKLIN